MLRGSLEFRHIRFRPAFAICAPIFTRKTPSITRFHARCEHPSSTYAGRSGLRCERLLESVRLEGKDQPGRGHRAFLCLEAFFCLPALGGLFRGRPRGALDEHTGSLPISIAAWDGENRLILCNRKFRQLYGIARASALRGASLEEAQARDMIAQRPPDVSGPAGCLQLRDQQLPCRDVVADWRILDAGRDLG